MTTRAIIIDDEDLIRSLVGHLIGSLGGELVGSGETGADAVPLYEAHRPDLVLLDINMPDVNGMAALRQLHDRFPDAHVVMLTAMTDTAMAESCMAAGARDFLRKDAGPEAMRDGLERVLADAAAPGHAPAPSLSSEVIDLLKTRASVRSFTDEAVSDDSVRAVLAAAQHAPTSSNLQAYSFVVVRDPDTKARLAELAGGQAHVAAAPVFVAICADIHRLGHVIALGGGDLAKGYLEMSLVAIIDAALTGMTASLVAESLDLGGCMIGGMRNDPEAVAETLGLPDGVFVVFGMTLGFPKDRPPSKPRYADEGVIHWERYEEKPLDDLTARYNAELEAQKEATDRADGVPWAERLAKGFSAPKRAGLKAALHNLGFDFD